MVDPMTAEWLKLLGLTTEYMEASEALIDGLQGRLGDDVKTRDQALDVIEQRVGRYANARRAVRTYAHERQAMLS